MSAYTITTQNGNTINFSTDLTLSEAVQIVKRDLLPTSAANTVDFIMRTQEILDRPAPNTKDPIRLDRYKAAKRNAALWMLRLAQQFVDSLSFRISTPNISEFFDGDNIITEIELDNEVLRLSRADDGRIWVNRLEPSEEQDKLYDSTAIGFIENTQLVPFMQKMNQAEVNALKFFEQQPTYQIVDKTIWQSENYYDAAFEELLRQDFHADDEEVKVERQKAREAQNAAITSDELRSQLAKAGK